MVVPMVLLKVAIHWLFSCYRYTARKFRIYGFLHKTQSRSSHLILSSCPNVTKCSLEKREKQNFVSDFYTLLRPTKSHFFPYFMLLAFEGGGLFRALLLLLSSPICWAFGYQSEISLRIMIFVAFCGLKIKDMELVDRAVLPKFYLESLHLQAYEVLATTEKKVVFSSLPRVMFEGFVREYLGVGEVVGAELKIFKGKYYSGFISCCGFESKHKALKQLFGETKADVGLVSYLNPHDHLFISHCKEAYIVSKDSNAAASSALPRDKYPKPLIFHDSRLAFLPTPLSILALFLFLPLSIPLSIARIALGVIPPYKFVLIFAALNGVRLRAHNHQQYVESSTADKKHNRKGTLYVCTHRTLLDPVMLATALQRPVPAVTYSLSPLSEAIAPMRTIRLTRKRDSDSDTILKVLGEGDLTICPEGTTCREPYLLRFSPLFAELADEIVPVALEASGSWFYGSTASGLKLFDPFFFFMNPLPSYRVRFLDRVPKEMTCAGGGWSGSDVANRIQKQLGDAMGYECTNLTRRDKYMMLAGNEGVVKKQQQEEKGS